MATFNAVYHHSKRLRSGTRDCSTATIIQPRVSAFALLFNTISGSSEGSGRKHTRCQIVPTSPTYATREMRLRATFRHYLNGSSPNYLCDTSSLGRDYTSYQGLAAALSNLVGGDLVGFRRGFTPDGRSSLSRMTHNTMHKGAGSLRASPVSYTHLTLPTKA